MVGMEAGSGRVLAFGGETWVWARASDEGRAAHRKFWRQVIFWLAHKEDKGENEVKLKLDARRVAVGQKLDFAVTARDAKGEPLPDVKYETKVDARRRTPSAKYPRPVDALHQGDEARGSYFANRPARATTGSRSSRPATARRSAATAPGSSSTRTTASWRTPPPTSPCSARSPRPPAASSSPPSSSPKYLRSLRRQDLHRVLQPDRAPGLGQLAVLPAFTTLLMLEWWLRKRHGWV